MRRLGLLVHISLDGFVAGPKGELDGFDASEENLKFVCSLTENADTILVGRNSFQLMNGYWPTARNHPKATQGEIAYSNWYNTARKIVISKTMEGDPGNNIKVIGENISNEIIQLKEEPGKDILIFGSPRLSQLLMEFNLIDDYWIFVNPSIFGQGIPLFARPVNQIKLKIGNTKQFANGEIAIHYIR